MTPGFVFLYIQGRQTTIRVIFKRAPSSGHNHIHILRETLRADRTPISQWGKRPKIHCCPALRASCSCGSCASTRTGSLAMSWQHQRADGTAKTQCCGGFTTSFKLLRKFRSGLNGSLDQGLVVGLLSSKVCSQTQQHTRERAVCHRSFNIKCELFPIPNILHVHLMNPPAHGRGMFLPWRPSEDFRIRPLTPKYPGPHNRDV